MCLPTNIPTYLPTYIHIYLPTYLPTYPYIHNFIRIVPIVPHPTFSGSNWRSFRYELKSVPVRFQYPLKFVPVRFGTHRSPFQYFHRSVSVRDETRSHFSQFSNSNVLTTLIIGIIMGNLRFDTWLIQVIGPVYDPQSVFFRTEKKKRFMQTESVLQTKNRSGPAKNRFSVALVYTKQRPISPFTHQ